MKLHVVARTGRHRFKLSIDTRRWWSWRWSREPIIAEVKAPH